MKIILLIALLASGVFGQQLPIWNVVTPYITNPYDGDTIDGRYAGIPYVDVYKSPTGVLKYNALRYINTEDHYTLSVHVKVPAGVGFYVTSQTDTSTFGVLYTYIAPTSDNQSTGPKDTVLTVDVPAGSYRYKIPGFYRFAIIRFWTPRQSYDMMFVDALTLKVHEPIDTVIEREDTIIIPEDTIKASVAPELPRGLRERYFDILGRKDCTQCIIIDSLGRKRWKRKY